MAREKRMLHIVIQKRPATRGRIFYELWHGVSEKEVRYKVNNNPPSEGQDTSPLNGIGALVMLNRDLAIGGVLIHIEDKPGTEGM